MAGDGNGWRLVTAKTPAAIDRARVMFREYQTWLNEDLCFQDFEGELAALPGDYAPPGGTILLAVTDEAGEDYADQAVLGCVALKPLAKPGTCEMKRLYLRDAGRGRGIGRALAEAVVAFARNAGYRVMRLDTLGRLDAALGLYRTMGFIEISAYVHNPLQGVLFMEKDLTVLS